VKLLPRGGGFVVKLLPRGGQLPTLWTEPLRVRSPAAEPTSLPAVFSYRSAETSETARVLLLEVRGDWETVPVYDVEYRGVLPFTLLPGCGGSDDAMRLLSKPPCTGTAASGCGLLGCTVLYTGLLPFTSLPTTCCIPMFRSTKLQNPRHGCSEQAQYAIKRRLT